MKTIATLAVAIILTGCGTHGEPLLLARMYDNNDPCQLQNLRGKTMNEKVANMPSFCGSAGNRQTIYATPNGKPVGAPVGYVKKN
jgi:hypothetical protein